MLRSLHAQRRAFAHTGLFRLPAVTNEPMKHYAPGSPERVALSAAIVRTRSKVHEVPVIINGKEIFTGDTQNQLVPYDHKTVLARVHRANATLIREAIAGSLVARKKWATTSFETRAAVFLKAADLLATKYRADACAATVVGQGKTAWQAEIDAAAELIDFWRFNPKYAQDIYSVQPPENATGSWNRVEYRPLEGYVVAITPFNFTAIGGNLPTSPILMGNVSLWKPSSTATYSNYVIYKVLEEAGLPPGVLQFLPGPGSAFAPAFDDAAFAGLHFTGSTDTFNTLWRQVANNLEKYRSYPRLVGETGGKNSHFIHPTADVKHAVNNTLRAAFEYSGQKCSACSRLYVPDTLWDSFMGQLVEETQKIVLGSPEDFRTFMSAVIDAASFKKITSYVDRAKTSPECKILVGGNYDNSKGYFISPTIIHTTNPRYETMTTELFGPVLTVYRYPADKWVETLTLVDESVEYALTGAFFAQDIDAIEIANRVLVNSAGNFYVNDKCTGAVVGQQPFGGARKSGTNDKAGFAQNLLRWVSARTVKTNFLPLSTWRYPSVDP